MLLLIINLKVFLLMNVEHSKRIKRNLDSTQIMKNFIHFLLKGIGMSCLDLNLRFDDNK